jgi:hypothetical protein
VSKNNATFFATSSRYNFNDTSDRRVPKLIFGSGSPGGSISKNYTECSTATTYVDAEVTCISRGSLGKASCGVGAIRKNLHDTDPPSMSVLTLPLFPYYEGAKYVRDIIKSFMETL